MGKAVPEQVSQVTRALGLRVLSGVVLRTPVDTGRARGNWQTTVGHPGPGQEIMTEDKGGGTVLSQGASSIAEQKGYQPIYLENNVPYIDRLEDGYSKQAPNGMVLLTLTELGLDPSREN